MKNVKRISTTLIILSALLLVFVLPVSAETVSVGSTTVAPGGTATVAIQVTGITTPTGGAGDISAATVKLTFNPAVVTVQSVTTGDLNPPVKSINNIAGTVIIATFSNNGITTAPVTLANVVFQGVSTAPIGATSPLTLTVTTLSDSNGVPHPATVTSGVVTIAGSGGSTTGTVITIQDANGNSSINGATNGVVPVSIVAKNVQNLAAATVTLSYDPSVVTVQSVSSGDIGRPTSNVNNNAGTTTISTFSLTGKSGNATIANLELKIVGSTGASTPLTIGVTTLSNSNANSIPNTISSGQLSVVQYLRGDMNCDNVVNIIDALLIAKYSVGLIPAPYTC